GKRDFEVYREPRGLKPLAHDGIDKGASPRRDDKPLFLRQFRKNGALARSETRLGFTSKDRWNIHSGPRLDDAVRIDEGVPQQAGGFAAHGRLARAHKSD